MYRKPFTTWFDAKLYEDLREAAYKKRTSMTALVKEGVTLAIKKYDVENKSSKFEAVRK
ncbi:MAG: hypothetical protein GY941_14060 [Planctomycetes bacterium]|nr:hypothetical protein [Planctomycetota bacterium]